MDYEQPYIISLLKQRHQEIFWNLQNRPKRLSGSKLFRKQTKNPNAKEKPMNRDNTRLMAILLLCFALSLIALAQAINP
jgi:hypothetical protein